MQTKSSAKRHQLTNSDIRGWGALRFALPVLASLVLFWPMLAYGQILGFRDTLHFYYPLWHVLDLRPYSEWLLPQFNYFDVVGSPIIGEPTSIVFYPPRLLLRIPGLSLERCIAVFLAFHLCLCWYLTYWIGHRFFRRTSFSASLLASGYTFGAMTYFGIYNPPYLISSTWIPLSVGSIVALLRVSGQGLSNRASSKTLLRWQLMLALSLAAMILGGDVQTPYNLALIVAGVLVYLTASMCWTTIGRKHLRAATFIQLFATFAVPFVLAGLVSAAQLLPTYYWYRLGTQGTDVSRAIGDDYTFRLLDVVTWFIPLGLGSYTPTHTRWVAAFDLASMWTPSLHTSMPIAVAILCSSAAIRYKRLRWLLVIATITLIAACGDALGLYGLITDWLPFYHFRYPIKWYAIAAFLVSLLGAYCLDLSMRSSRVNWNKIRLGVAIVGALNLLVGLFVLAMQDRIAVSINSVTVQADRLCGAFDFKASVKQLAVVTSLTSLWSGLFVYFTKHRNRQGSIGLVMAELATFAHLVAIAWMITTPIPLASISAELNSSAIWRTADQDVPIYWSSKDTQRLAEQQFISVPRVAVETAKFQRQQLVGKLHLMTPGRSLSAQLSLKPRFYDSGENLDWLKPHADPSSAENTFQVQLQNEQVSLVREDASNSVEIMLPILQDGGWEPVEPQGISIQANQHLISVLLPAGVKNVTLRYRTPGLKIGACFSLFTLTVLVFVIYRKNV